MRCISILLGFTAALLLLACLFPGQSVAQEEETVLEEMVVKPEEHTEVEPSKTKIDLEEYPQVGITQNVGEFLKDQPIIDFRGESDLVPDDDLFYMRGFSGSRFATALDGATIRKTGGRRSSHIVDYALLPPFLIESVEVLPGPHSVLYPGKSIGGTVNFISRAPQRHHQKKPDFSISTSYGDYATQNHNMAVEGGMGDFTYDLGYQKYATDGYLRHHEADIDTLFGRIGYILPNDGYLTYQASYTEADRQFPVKNDPDDPDSDYDSDYPVTDVPRYYQSEQKQLTWDKEATNHRVQGELPSPAGDWSLSAYHREEEREHYVDEPWETHWKSRGGKMENDFQLAQGHQSTVGTEVEQHYDATDDESYHERIRILSGFAQHEWQPLPSLSLTGGLRFEDVTVHVDNERDGELYITGEEEWIERNWSSWSPKSFLIYELDEHADWLRDTSLSAGVSRIWRAPDYHGHYNPQGRPAGAWLEPEHGVGYDAVLSRRLIGDIGMRLNYSYYRIKDYIAWNRDFAEYGDHRDDPTDPAGVEPGKEYKDYVINLEEMVRQGVEMQLEGDLTRDLGFMLGWAYQDFESKGDEPAGEEAMDQRPEHRVNAKLSYRLQEATRLVLDYEYQHEQVAINVDEVEEEVYEITETEIDPFHVFDLGIEHRLFEQWRGFREGVLDIYVNNLLDNDYVNSSGYPATDRTMGAALSFGF